MASQNKGRMKLNVDFPERAITAEELTPFSKPPSCAHHDDVPAQFCCTNCDTLPLCDVCCRVRHRHHRTLPVKEVAAEKRAEIKEVMARMDEAAGNLKRLPERIKTTREKLHENVRAAEEKVLAQYNRERNKILQQMKEADEEYQRRVQEIQREHEETERALKEAMEREIQEIKERYARMENNDRSENT